MNSRDEFTPQIKNAVAARAGWRCSFAGCGRPTVGPSDESSKAVTMIGHAAHISGASPGPGSRRYISSMTPAQRTAIDNAIWLCATHAVLIDRDEITYSVDLLHEMKLAHEKSQAKALRSGDNSDYGAGLLALGPEAVFTGDIEAISTNSWTLRLKHFVLGDIHRLIAFIDHFPKTNLHDRYVISQELGDGRVLSAAPCLMREGDGFIVHCLVQPAFSRINAQQLGSSSALHPETNDLYIDKQTGNIARVAGFAALPQYIRSALSMQRGESVFEPAAGMRFFEYFEGYQGSPWLGSLLTVDVIRQASVPGPTSGYAEPRTPLQCVTRVYSFELLAEEPVNNQLPVRMRVEVQGIGPWQHEFWIHIPPKDEMERRATILSERPDLRIK